MCRVVVLMRLASNNVKCRGVWMLLYSSDVYNIWSTVHKQCYKSKFSRILLLNFWPIFLQEQTLFLHFVSKSVCVSIHRSINLFIYVSIDLSIHQSVCNFIYLLSLSVFNKFWDSHRLMTVIYEWSLLKFMSSMISNKFKSVPISRQNSWPPSIQTKNHFRKSYTIYP